MSESKPVTAPGVDTRPQAVVLPDFRDTIKPREQTVAPAPLGLDMDAIRADRRNGLRQWQVDALIAEVERLQSQPSGWRPISQHDEGGTNVLLWDTEDRRAYIGYRSEGDEFLHETEEWPIRASHFQLLPPPPQEQP